MQEWEKGSVKLGIGSQTEAQKARKILSSFSGAAVVKIENRLSDGGCLYGIRIRKEDLSRAMRALRDAGIYSSVVSQ